MAPSATVRTGGMASIGHLTDLIFPVGIIASVLVIMVPMPPGLLDVLLAANITLAVIVLLTTIYIRTPLEFSIFPSLLLATTLARLVLNVATTRLVLTRAGADGLLAAGHVVKAFGEFVAGNELVVGVVIFVIVIIIQFLVITKGATRISEVAARFALDGMPGRQMAIDADLNAGVIDEHEAQRRRQEITRQADFFGAMDGASKFVRGDAIAGILITLINIIGGLIIGMVELGMSPGQAASVFTKLTIGDGLVSQVPAFLISLAAGLLVTRSSYDSNLPVEFMRQLFSRPQALAVTGAFLGVLIFTNLPAVPLLLIGGGCLGMSMIMARQKKDESAVAAANKAKAAKKPAEERIEDYLATDPMEIELGVGLIRLADPKRGGDLLERIHASAKTSLPRWASSCPRFASATICGLKRINTASRSPTCRSSPRMSCRPRCWQWIPAWRAARFAASNARTGVQHPGRLDRSGPARSGRDVRLHVIEPASVLATHLTETVRRHADELLTRDAAKHLIDELKQTQPATVDELIPGQMKLAEVQRRVARTLREQVPIRQLAAILETLGDYASRTKDPMLLTEYVRHRLARTICTRYRDKENRLFVVSLDPALEDRIKAGIEHGERGMFIRMSPQAIEVTCRLISAEIDKLVRGNHPPIVLVSPQFAPA